MKKIKFCKALGIVFCILCLCTGWLFTASAYYGTAVYLDCDNDGYEETYIMVEPLDDSYAAEICEISSEAEKVIIPSVVDLRDDGWEDWYEDDWYYDDEYYERPLTVTSIYADYEENSYKSIVIPSTVTYIEPETIGYYTEIKYEEVYDEYDDWYYYEEYEVKTKAEDFVIYCLKGSAADVYAQSNGFETVYTDDISSAEITLSNDSFYYEGSFIKPDVTVTFQGEVLTLGEDYDVFYCNNLYIGTAEVIIAGKGDYTGVITKTFEITAVPASEVEVSAIGTQYYTGWEIYPYFEVSYNGETLWCYDDYNYEISNNINPGQGKIEITFDGDMFEGSKTVYFTIAIEPMEYFTVTALSDSQVYLQWDYVPCGKYYIYRYSDKTGKYEYIGKTANTYYTDKNLKEITKYKYAVKAVKSSKSNTALKEAVRTMLKTPELTLATKNKAATLTWTKNSNADGYQIYRSSNWADTKKVKTVRDNATTKWTNKKLNNDYDYFFSIRAYKKINGKTYYSNLSPTQYSGSSKARVNGANLESHTSFKVYNVQGKKTTFMYNINLNETDIKLLDNFKKKYFKEGMTREEQLQVTLDWINKNVTYALGDDWAKISGKTWVQAIFKYKLGQCAQYNGAMAAMMAYLGYDVQVVMGYRGTWQTNYWQHFWTEVKIQGSTYIVETGNYGRSGSWSHLIKKYSEAPGYIRNQKNK